MDAIDILTGETLKPYKLVYLNKFLISSEGEFYSYFSEGSLDENAVPKLTSNIGSNGVAFSSNATTGTGLNAYEAFDRIASTRWGNSNVNLPPSWVGYQFNIPRKVVRYTIDCPNTTYYPSAFQFQASNDGVNYVSLHTVSGNSSGKKDFNIQNESSYKYYRIYITAVIGSSTLPVISELEFFAEPIREFKVLSDVTERDYVNHGMSADGIIDLHDEINNISHIFASNAPLGSGKVIRQKIDRSKHKAHKIILGK